jgi:hypothetical protein
VHFTIDAHRVLAEGAVDKDEAAAVKSGEGVARVAAKIPVKPGEKLTLPSTARTCSSSTPTYRFFAVAK